MLDHRTGVSLVLVVCLSAFSACAPRVTGGDGEAAQAAEEGADSDGDGDAPPPKDGDPHEGECGGDPGAGTCEVLVVGDQATCSSPGDLKSAAADVCASSGRILVDLSPAWDCEGGASTMAKGVCCDSGAPAGDPVPPDSGPAPAGGFGDGVTCVANSDYLAMADAVCAEIGLSLIDLYTTDDCSADASTYAKYICGSP